MIRTIHPEVRIGHVHLTVSNLERAVKFYRDAFGFEVTQRYGTNAAFLSAGGYHHHIGLNTWHSSGAKPTPETAAGLQTFVIAIPTREGLQEVKERLVAYQVPFEEEEDLIRVNDPWINQILLSVQPTNAN